MKTERQRQRRVDEYFARKRISDTDFWLLLTATLIVGTFVLGELGTSYIELVFTGINALVEHGVALIAGIDPASFNPMWQLREGRWVNYVEAALIGLSMGALSIIERRKAKAEFLLRVTGRKYRRPFA